MYNKINSVKNDISDVDVWGKFTVQSMDKYLDNLSPL